MVLLGTVEKEEGGGDGAIRHETPVGEKPTITQHINIPLYIDEYMNISDGNTSLFW